MAPKIKTWESMMPERLERQPLNNSPESMIPS